jgi:hypothetical protein
MKIDGAWAALVLAACTPERPAADGTGTGGSGEPTAEASTTDAPPVADDTGTTGEPGPPCVAWRHTLLDADPCGRLAIGDLEADGVDDLLVLPGFASFIQPAVIQRRLHTYRGGQPLLPLPEIFCCIEVGNPAALTLVDINGDGRADPIYVVDQTSLGGDVVSNFVAVEMLVRGPLGGYVGGSRLLQAAGVALYPPVVATGALLPDRPALVATDGMSSVGLLAAEGLAMVPASEGPWVTLDADIEAMATTDLDGDGLDDVVAVLPGRLALLHSLGDGTLVLAQELEPAVLGDTVLVGDLDGLGGHDLLLPSSGGIGVGLVSPGTLVWLAQPELEIEGPSVLVDANGDGVLDLATIVGAELVVYLGAGDGTFTVPPQSLSPGVGEVVQDLAAGDLDGDGRDDLAVCDELGVLVVHTTAGP